MASLPTAAAQPAPTLVLIHGAESRQFSLARAALTIGRRADNDLVIRDFRCSRCHARIELGSDGYYVVDLGSKLGTFVNGELVRRRRLQRNDRIEFGGRGGAYLLFAPERQPGMSETDLFVRRAGGDDLASLKLLLQAARKLNSATVLEDVLTTLLDSSLRLTGAQRACLFFRGEDGRFHLAAGRSATGEFLLDDVSISHSTMEEAVASGAEFVATQVQDLHMVAEDADAREQGLCSVICIPLRHLALDSAPAGRETAARTVLYLDSRSLSGLLPAVKQDMLRTIATEAAALVENAFLLQKHETSRLYEQELAVAASMQQALLAVRIPEVSYVEVRTRSLPCRQVGGDFFEIVRAPGPAGSLLVALADVCGKGVSAALFASVLQGLIYSRFVEAVPLQEVASVIHGFLRGKEIGEKYVALILARLEPDGSLELLNCGHLPPLLVTGGVAAWTQTGGPPIGLLPDAVFRPEKLRLRAGDRLLTVTDGVTEAKNSAGAFFGRERLQRLAAASLDAVLAEMQNFSGSVPPQDDCTGVELLFRG